MMARTHLAFSFLLALLTFEFFTSFNTFQFYIYTIILLFASLLPDIDITTSKLGKRIKLVGFIFEHRGIFHTLLIALLFALLMSYYIPDLYVYAFLIGYLSHLALDMCNYKSLHLFYPIKWKIKGFTKVNSFIERVFLVIFIIMDAGLLFYYL